MQALERLEELPGKPLVKSSAVVADEINGIVALLLAAKLDARIRISAGEFPGIAQQVLHDYQHQAPVSGDVAARQHDTLDVAIRVCRCKVLEDGVNHGTQVKLLEVKTGAVGTREVQ